MSSVEELKNYQRKLAWAVRVHEAIAKRCKGQFEEYLPSRWRLRLPASGIDIAIADSANELIEEALVNYEHLKC